MKNLRRATLVVLLAPLLGGLGTSAGCASKLAPRDGTCVVIESPLLDCNVDASGEVIYPADAGMGMPELVSYACTGTVRPDDGAVMIEGVPKGRICADRGQLGDTNQRGYCCTDFETNCAYDPTDDCPKDPVTGEKIRDGFECQGPLRPEMYNPSIYCDQAVKTDTLFNYCCADTRLSWGCTPDKGCPPDLAAWNCKNGVVPRSQELTVSKSRADTYFMTCSMPTPNPDGKTQNYCCYTPSIIPDGGTCLEDTNVPGCASGRFGFACIGPDKPTDSFLPMKCPEPGFPGYSMQGYKATLFCCDFTN